jgi:predicted ATPase
MRDKPFVMKLHPHFNAIIGGRGTGKSTVLESLRIASRRGRELEETPKLKEELEKFMRLASSKGVMLNDTELLLAIHRRGRDYRLRWRYDAQGEALEEHTAEGEWVPCEPGDLRERFPLSIFSQKQINELASNPKGLLEILDRSPQVNRTEWQRQWEITKSQFLQFRERQREITRQLAQEPQIRARLQDVESDLKQYEEKGHGEILKNYQKRSQQLHALPLEDSFNHLAADIREVAERSSISDFPHHVFEEQDPTMSEVRDIHELTGAKLQTIQNALNAIALSVNELEAERGKRLKESRWHAAVLKAIESYQTLAKEYEEKNSHLDLNLYGQWVQQRGQLHQQMTKMEALRREAEQVQDQIEQIFGRLHQLRQELLVRRNSFIVSVIGDNPYVQMELVQFGDIGNAETEYRTILGLNEDGFKSSILDRDEGEGLLRDLFHWEAVDTTGASLPRIIHDLKEVTEKIASGGTEEVPINIHGKLATRLQRAHEQQPANLDQLWCWWPEDLLRVQYARDPQARRFEDLEKGSAGQKAAAILAFLLSHGDEPLIMDQPEDDLDNALIYDLVVRQIHANKNRRQLIIVTHNPNIVVNGDAELVNVLKFERGQVQLNLQGGLEEEPVRNAICDIMEGGREAFEKRYKRITLEV